VEAPEGVTGRHLEASGPSMKGSGNCDSGPNHNSGPTRGVKDEQWKLLHEMQTDSWKVQGVA
jgi:hypothetical protein